MSNLTDYGENRFADMLRGQGLTLPTSWKMTPLSAASDSAFTEITGSGIARHVVTRSLANFAGTQAPASTLVSSGTSKTTSNNIAINMGTAAGSVGTMTHVGFLDASDNCWAYAELPTPIVTAAAVDLVVPIGDMVLSFGVTGGASNYLINKLIDKFFRGQTYDYPASVWLAEFVSGGSEVGGGVGYARKQLDSTLAALSGTQSAGSTSASSGTGGRISNNAQIAFADPTGSHGDIDRLGVYDVSTSGNQLWLKALGATKTVGVGFPLVFQADKIGFTFA